jgi:NAD-dependent SIR2 family protein deacetylase
MHDGNQRDDLQRAAELIQQADALIVAAGAGMGVDSGLPDFRGNSGFWQAYPALGRARLDFTAIANPQQFLAAPALAWGFYGHRLALYRRTVPHAGFAQLKAWGELMPQGYSVFTSNVDGQFQKAGFDADRIHECHGSIHHLQCLQGCNDLIWSADDFVPDVDEEHCQLRNAAPSCPHCGGMARPNILMFGDWDWLEYRQQEQAQHQQAWLEQVQRPVVVELGAGSAIPSVRMFSRHIVQHYGGRLIRINLRESEVDHESDVGLALGAQEALLGIAQAIDASP